MNLKCTPFATSIQVPIPLKYVECTDPDSPVPASIRKLTLSCGGCTSTLADGWWVDHDGTEVHDDVSLYTWHVKRTGTQAAILLAQELVVALLEAGENCVLMEEFDRNGHEVFMFSRNTSMPTITMRD